MQVVTTEENKSIEEVHKESTYPRTNVQKDILYQLKADLKTAEEKLKDIEKNVINWGQIFY